MSNTQHQPVMDTILPLAPEDLDERIYNAVRRALQEAASRQEQKPDAGPEWGSRQDAARIAGVSLPTIHALMAQGLIEARKVGRRTVINLADLREKLASGEISKYRKPLKHNG